MTGSQRDARAALWAKLGWDPPPARADEALTHRSYANEQLGRRSQAERKGALDDNQRLEFLGDAVLGLAVSELLVDAHPHAAEGELSRMRAALVKAEALAEFAREVGVGDALRLGRGADAAGERQQMNVLADAVEALVAAAYLDGGLPRARSLVALIVGDRVSQPSEIAERDPKSALQEEVQATGQPAPTYHAASVDGPPHERVFSIEVRVGDVVLATGQGRSKKLAEQAAARAALARRRDVESSKDPP